MDDRRMNLIVRPDGTAELDDRRTPDVVIAVLGLRGVVGVRITVDGEVVGRAYTLGSNADDLNDLARLTMVELTGRHFEFSGPVVFGELDDGLAHLLLEVARDR